MPAAAVPLITLAVAGTQIGLQEEKAARAGDVARRQRRETGVAIGAQQELEEEARAGLRGELTQLEDPFARLVRQREALSQVRSQFEPAQQQAVSQLLARGRPGAAQQLAGQAEIAQAAAQAQAFRNIFLQDEAARRGIVGQISQITGQAPPSLLAQQTLAGQGLQAQQLQQSQSQNTLRTLLDFINKSGAGFLFPGTGSTGQTPTVRPEVQVGSPFAPVTPGAAAPTFFNPVSPGGANLPLFSQPGFGG